jgi:hypothetical protein
MRMRCKTPRARLKSRHNHYFLRLLRKARKVLTPKGMRIAAPAIQVEGSGTGVNGVGLGSANRLWEAAPTATKTTNNAVFFIMIVVNIASAQLNNSQ